MRPIYILIPILGYVAYLAIDFFIFRKRAIREERQGIATHAGGLLFIEGNKTYYTLPKGTRRKIADYAMDLSPGSVDMQKFETIMKRAYEQHEKDKLLAEKDATSRMQMVARESMKGEKA